MINFAWYIPLWNAFETQIYIINPLALKILLFIIFP